ncbi:MAG TPA: hypothetical protein VL357_07420 [Rariglobus sp.]|jgi:hypothetical protein|nr:hypothetical protein [Rariglobus sp.]
MSDAAPSKSSFGLTFLAAIGGFVIFVVILLVAYLPQKPAAIIGDGVKTPEQRKAALAELRAHETKVATSYAWVDQSKGVVQLPIDRAIELTLRDLETKQK